MFGRPDQKGAFAIRSLGAKPTVADETASYAKSRYLISFGQCGPLLTDCIKPVRGH